MINKYLNQLETHLKRIDIFMDYSFSYKIDQDAGTLKIWINATFQGGSRFDGFESVDLVGEEGMTVFSTTDFPIFCT